MKKVLVAEDEESIRDFIVINLTRSGYDVEQAENGAVALDLFSKNESGFDVAILDIMMPEMDGLTVCKELRKRSSDLGIIMLSAKTQEMDKVTGLLVGADDYVTKPFDAKEVMARIKAVLRRTKGEGEAAGAVKKVVVYDKLEINIENYEMKVNGVVVDTPPKELELIYHFASNPNRVYTRDQLLDEVWGFDYYGDSRTVDVHVKRLREKLEGVSDKWSLKTVWGVGYKFETKD